ncbi:hypothetical protein Q4578_10895 [Shimia thalassica]|uniref:hypothetical protein n=1 Tax=Shimia thalassica TaxID=1715693 RepID=UPI0026E23FE7|nr:hypothetical protein [Shimia thalassica]MDO6522098.1 hypothetical protein [Shimia thalassica]
MKRNPVTALGLCFSALLASLPALAQEFTCQEDTQCRGDAETKCATSTLEIKIKPRGGHTDMWIAGEGPYAASRARDGDMRRWAIKAFGGSHRLDLQPDGSFLYLGNRNKRFTGTCTET